MRSSRRGCTMSCTESHERALLTVGDIAGALAAGRPLPAGRRGHVRSRAQTAVVQALSVRRAQQHPHAGVSAARRDAGVRILIDTGLGNKLTDKQRRNFRVEEDWALDEDLAVRSESRPPTTSTSSSCTHMDWDHCERRRQRAWSATTSCRRSDGPATSCSGTNGRRRLNPDSRTRHGYWPENWAPLRDAGRVDIVDGDVEIVPGVRLHKTGGHTHGHQIVRIESGGEDDAAHGGLAADPCAYESSVGHGLRQFPSDEHRREGAVAAAGAARRAGGSAFTTIRFVLAAKVDADGRVQRRCRGRFGVAAPADESGLVRRREPETCITS